MKYFNYKLKNQHKMVSPVRYYTIPNLKESISQRLIQKFAKMAVDTYSAGIYSYPDNDLEITQVPCEVIIEAIYESMMFYFPTITLYISGRILDLVLKTLPSTVNSQLLVDQLVKVINRLYTELKND